MAHRTRREFLQTISTTAAGLVIGSAGSRGWARSPNEKLNIGIIGVNHRGRANFDAVLSQNIAALCDVDARYLGEAAKRHPNAKTYRDFRKLLDQKDLDAVTVSTPDHCHAPASAMALRAGKHVYCEKPLSHSVYEARKVAELALETGLATQMGTQIHANDNYRRVVEAINTGVLGAVGEVHVWVGKTWSGGERPQKGRPVPEYLDWDLWLGPAPERPYHPTYCPANWRRWWDFGGGTLGDMGCHFMDLPFWALHLRHPLTVEAKGPEVHPETAPKNLIVNYRFPRRGSLPPVDFTWYDTDMRPPHLKEHDLPQWGSGVLFVGEKGMMLADYGRHILYPRDDFEDYEPPRPYIPKSIGHHNEWIHACRTGAPTTCNFDYSGSLTEAVLLGNVAFRTGKKLEWNGQKLEATNCPEASRYLKREYRKGWSL